MLYIILDYILDYMYVCMYVCMYICILYICIYVYMYTVYMYMYIYRSGLSCVAVSSSCRFSNALSCSDLAPRNQHPPDGLQARVPVSISF